MTITVTAITSTGNVEDVVYPDMVSAERQIANLEYWTIPGNSEKWGLDPIALVTLSVTR